jgi:hypothetical protein
MTNKYQIAVLLPTRGRTTKLSRSVISLVNRAVNLPKIQFLFALDNDDEIGLDHFTNEIQPYLDEKNVNYTAMSFDTLGYDGLNVYYNTLAESADADWLFIWNDDAIMETSGWDRVISKYTGQFKILKIHTHNEHPYSIFPIVPADWYKLTGYFSRHQMIDAELSQIAYMLDVIEIVNIYAVHDRPDIAGGDEDATDKARYRFEGNPADPRDFHNPDMTRHRMIDADKLSAHMKSLGLDTTWWEESKVGKRNPWEKMQANDVNKQMVTVQARQ